MAGVDKNLRVWTFKGISPVFPSVLVFQFFSYKMTICKAPDVTHFVEEIPQRIKVWFFRFVAFRGHCVLFWGALEGMLGSSSGMPRTQRWENHVLQSVVFFVFWPLGAIVYCFRGPWRACWGHLQECHEPVLQSVFFFVFWRLGAIVYWRACWGHLQECHEPNDEKNTFYKVWFFRFLAFRRHCVLFWGALEGILGSSSGMPRTQRWKKHVLQSVVFSFFGL